MKINLGEDEKMSMSIDGTIIRENNVKKMVRPFYAKFKKHYCISCGSSLKMVWISQSIYRNSSEAVGKRLVFGPSWLFKKPIMYSFAIFECQKCGQKISINDQYYSDYPNKHRPINEYDDYHQYCNGNGFGIGQK